MGRILGRVSPLIQCFRASSSTYFLQWYGKTARFIISLWTFANDTSLAKQMTQQNKIRNFNGHWPNLCESAQKWFKWGMDSVLRRARKGTQYSITRDISTTWREKSWEVKNVSSSQVYTLFNKKNLHTLKSRVLLLFGQSNKRFWTHSTLKGFLSCMIP